MNKTVWKLQIAGERLWLLANMTAQQSATLEVEGRGLAVVAEETRNVANLINNLVECALFENEEIKPDKVRDIAFRLNLLALNNAFESSRLRLRGKAAAVCAEDIRNLAYEITVLFDGNDDPNRFNSRNLMPIPKDRMTSVDRDKDFLVLNIAGLAVTEPLASIKEVCICAERTETHIKLRGMEIPLIDGFKMLGKPQREPTCVLLQTPWAGQNKTYAVAADVSGIIYSPICMPSTVPSDLPLSEYVREYWESENDVPFCFMDWPRMLGK